MSNYKCRMITRTFFQTSVELSTFAHSNLGDPHWFTETTRSRVTLSSVQAYIFCEWTSMWQHTSGERAMIRKGLVAGQCLVCVFQNTPTHDQWFGLCNKGSPVAWLSALQTEENDVSRASGTLQGLRCYQSSRGTSKTA